MKAKFIGLALLALFISIVVYYGRGYAINNVPFWIYYKILSTATVLTFGIYVIKKRKNQYIRKRTISLMLSQVFLVLVIPTFIFTSLGSAVLYPWPLVIRSIFPERTVIFLAYGLLLTFVVLPVGVYLYGLRFYCGFLCGCGALAETLGDPVRRLAPKSELSRRLNFVPLVVFVLAVVVTLSAYLGDYKPMAFYDLFIFVGLNFGISMAAYPFFGGRIWCRYFCPTMATLGFISKRGRFAIVPEMGKCISCKMCTENCEMGIDVMYHAERGLELKSDRCVGCGICISICPKKVLRFKP